MKIYYDCEFYEASSQGVVEIELISIGMVRSDGEKLYFENVYFNWGRVPDDHWLQDNVRPHMWGAEAAASPAKIRDAVLDFAGSKPEFYGWYSDYDHVLLCSLFGRMNQLPDHFPRFTRDLKQMTQGLKKFEKPDQDGIAHRAIDDAIWNKQLHEAIVEHKKHQGYHPSEAGC